jgi:hypothetical protein
MTASWHAALGQSDLLVDKVYTGGRKGNASQLIPLQQDALRWRGHDDRSGPIAAIALDHDRGLSMHGPLT